MTENARHTVDTTQWSALADEIPSMTENARHTVDTTQWSALADEIPSILADTKQAGAFEDKYVHHIYDAIAPHYASTRTKRWRFVTDFLQSLAPGSLVLDAGCGNGKYFYTVDCLNGYIEPIDNEDSQKASEAPHTDIHLPIIMTGVDASFPFLEPLSRPHYTTSDTSTTQTPPNTSQHPPARIKLPEKWTSIPDAPSNPALSLNPPHVVRSVHAPPRRSLAQADILALPFHSSSFDAVMSIAVIHHLTTPARRIQALSELCRISRDGGVALVSAWARESAGRPDDATITTTNTSTHEQASTDHSSSSIPSNSTGETKCRVTVAPEVMVPWRLPSRYRRANAPAPPALPSVTDVTDVTDKSGVTVTHKSSLSTASAPTDGATPSTGSETAGPSHDFDEEMQKKWSLPPPPGMSRTQYRRHLKNQADQRKKAQQEKNAVYLRYYHMFERGELSDLASAVCIMENGVKYGWVNEKEGLMEENHYILLRKVRLK